MIGTKVYLWGGGQDSLPSVHDSVEKRLFLSLLDIFDIETGKKSLIIGIYSHDMVLNFILVLTFEFHSVLTHEVKHI